MKKMLIQSAVCLLLVLACVGCSSLPSGEKNADSQSAQSQESKLEVPTDGMGKRLAAAYLEMMSSKSFTLHGMMIAEGKTDGAQMQAELWTSVRGEVVGTKTVADVMGMTMNMHMIMAEGQVYMVNHDAKTYTLMMDASTMPDTGLGNADTLQFQSEGIDSIGDKKLPYEEYLDSTSGDTTRFYFENNQLYAVVVRDLESTTVMRVMEMHNRPDDSLLTIPTDYTEDTTGAGDILGNFGLNDLDLSALEDSTSSMPDLSPEDLSALQDLDLSGLEGVLDSLPPDIKAQLNQ